MITAAAEAGTCSFNIPPSCFHTSTRHELLLQFVGVEAVVCVVKDMWPWCHGGRWRRELLTAGYVIVSFVIGLTMVTRVCASHHGY